MQRATALIAAAAAFVTSTTTGVDGQTAPNQFIVKGQPDVEGPPSIDDNGRPTATSQAKEAPTGFDNKTNGFLDQGPSFDSINEDTVVAKGSFNDNRFLFEDVEHIGDGLGPV